MPLNKETKPNKPIFWFNYFFLNVLLCSLCVFLNFCVLAFAGFLLLSNDAFFLSHFSLTAIDSHRTLHVTFGLVVIYSAVASIWVVRKFSYSSFGLCFSDVSWEVSDLFLTVTLYWLLISLLVIEDHSYRVALTVYFIFQQRLGWLFAETILWSKDTPSKTRILQSSKRYLSITCL